MKTALYWIPEDWNKLPYLIGGYGTDRRFGDEIRQLVHKLALSCGKEVRREGNHRTKALPLFTPDGAESMNVIVLRMDPDTAQHFWGLIHLIRDFGRVRAEDGREDGQNILKGLLDGTLPPVDGLTIKNT